MESILQSSSALARWPGWCCKHMRMADRNFAPNLFGTCRRMRSIDKSRIIPCGSSGCAEVHAKRQQPKAQMSAAGVTGWPSSTSGLLASSAAGAGARSAAGLPAPVGFAPAAAGAGLACCLPRLQHPPEPLAPGMRQPPLLPLQRAQQPGPGCGRPPLATTPAAAAFAALG